MSSEDPIDQAADAIGTAIYDSVEAYMDHHARGVPADQGAASELIEEDTKAAEARLVEASAALKLAISTALRAK
jgi:hypothetical protein